MSEKRQSTGTNTNMKSTLELTDKDFKGAFIRGLHQAIKNMLDISEKAKSQQIHGG